MFYIFFFFFSKTIDDIEFELLNIHCGTLWYWEGDKTKENPIEQNTFVLPEKNHFLCFLYFLLLDNDSVSL